ncbi:MAG: fibronectin type III domain-containing protein [Lachnospiraceae bacterium]|nr:fibronectin type III domain-containing protein [Lachnospiraceae bacterium]
MTTERTQSTWLWKALALLAAFLVLLTVGGQRVLAADTPAKVTGLEQTGDYTTSVDISWDAVVANDIRYEVDISSTAGSHGSRTEDAGTSTSDYIYNLSAGCTYYISVRAYVQEWVSGTGYVYTYGEYSDQIEVVTRPASAPTSVSQTSATTTSITISWPTVSGANSYLVKYYPSGSSSSSALSKTTTSNKVKITGLSKNTKYYFYVYAQCVSSTTGYTATTSGSAYSSALPVLPTKVTGVTWRYDWLNINSASFSCNERASAEGYQYYIYSYSNTSKKIKSGTTTSYSSITVKSSKLKQNKFYAIKIRAYITIDGVKKYGEWSSLTYFGSQPKTVKITKSSGKLKMSWSKVSGATSYTIYVSTSKPSDTSDMTKVKTTTKTSYTLTKLKKKKISKSKTYYVMVIANRKVGSKTYKSISSLGSLTYYKK